MNRILLFVLLIVARFSFAQTNPNSQDMDPNNGFVVASQFGVTRPIRDIFRENPVDENKPYREKYSGDRKMRPPQQFPNKAEDDPKYGNDEGIMQKGMGHIEGEGTKANWQGQTATGFRPYDPSGAAGPNHYVQMINSTTFKVYNKTTGVVILTGTLGNLWSPATANAGDPIVMYDKAADRWFLAQFGSGNNNIYIAVSTSGDPTGSYYTYTFVSPQFPDYLKFSVWTDGYYMTSNQAQKVFAFERTAMLAGVPTARSVYTSYSPPQGGGFFVPLPGDAADGTLPPAGTPCPIFSYSDNGWGGSNIDAVQIYQMAVNWVPATPTGTITLAAAVPTAAFDASYNASWNDCSQPGTTQKLDGIGGIVMYRAQWKSWAGYNTVVLNWAVRINASQRSIMWCELRQDQTTGVWSIYQQGIYTPDAATRWMGSMAMDNNGAIGIAYIKSDATSIYPGLYYTGRRPCDPLGTLPVTEVEVAAGTGYQTGTNRVGDYAHTCLDPDGVTFWSTGEYMGGSSGSAAARTRIFSFTLPTCSTDASVSIAVTGGSNPVCPGQTTTFTALGVNAGSNPVYQWQVDGNNVGTNSTIFSSSTLTAGQVVTCIMTSDLPGVTNNPATSNAINISVGTPVTPAVEIAITGGTNPTCPGVGVTFTATPVNGGLTPFYQWKVDGNNAGTNSNTFTSNTLINGQEVTCELTSSLTCTTNSTANSNAIVITVTSSSNASVTIAQTSGSNPICAGSPASFTATVVGGNAPSYQWKVDDLNVGSDSPTYASSSLTNGQVVSCSVTTANSCPVIATLGTGTTYNGSTSALGAAYPTYYGNGRQQWLIRASELTALGFTAGNIGSLGFDVGNTTGDPITLNGYTIKMAHTSATVLTTTFQTPTFTTVFGPVNYTPVLNSINTHTFSNNFNWNGTSNVIVDICFSNQVVGNAAYVTKRTQPGFTTCTYYQADNSGGAGACSQATGTTTTWRPIMVIATNPGSATVNSNTIVMNVTAAVTPSVSISLTSGTNPTCSGSSLTFTATPTNGGATPSYQWLVNGSNAGTNSPTFTTSSLSNGQTVSCVMTSNASCASPATATSNSIIVNVTTSVTPSVSIALTSGTNPTCSGSSLTFTATPTNGGATPSYQWLVNGSNAGTNSPTFTTSSLTNGQTVSCVLTSNASCASPATATSNSILVNVTTSVTPSVSIALTSGTNPTCSGSSLTFTATPTNGGATPSYQWLVNGSNAGTNSPTFTTSSLTNGQTVSCVMTSNASCASPATATSNSILVNVITSVTPSVSIALTSGTNPTCSGSSLTFTATPTNGGATPSYQWLVNGSNAGTNSPTFTTSSLTNGQTVSCVMTSNASCASPATATSNSILVNVTTSVTPSVSIALTSGTNPTCSGSSLTFTATPTNGGAAPSYQWLVNGSNAGTNSPTFTTSSLTNGQTVSCVMTSNASCASPATATSNSILVNVTTSVTPSVSIALTSGTNPTCSGSSLTFTATPTNGGATPSYQWLVNGSNAGTNSPTFTTSSLTNGQTVSCVMTSNASCASPATATSNSILVNVTTSVTPSVSIALTSGTNPTCSGSSLTFTATPTNGGVTPSYQWLVNGSNAGTNSPTFTTSSLTNGQTVSCVMTSNASCASPATATSNSIVMTVTTSVTPSVSVALTSGTNPTCSGSSLTFTATPTNGGVTPSYQWLVNGSNAGTNSPTFTTSSLTNGQTVSCVMTSNASCASPATATSNSILVNVTAAVTPSVSIALTSGTNPTCSGSSLTFTATPTNGGATPSYQWLVNGSNAGTNSPTFTTSSLTNGQTVSCVMTSNASCASPATATSNSILVNVTTSVTPSVSIVLTSGTNPTCSGSSLTFTATPTNGGATPSYQWLVNGSNAGTNSPTFTTSSLTNGQTVSCVMTSNASCASPATATSNSILVNVTTSVTPSVSIALTSGTNPTCSGSSLTFTATPTNGGATPSYQWLVNGSNAGTNSPTFTTSSLTNGQTVSCVMTSNTSCASPATATSNSIVMTVTTSVTPSVSIALTSGTNPTCSGSSLTFTATPTNGGATPSYQWLVNGSNAGTNSPTFTTSSLTNGLTVSCVMTSNAACVTTNSASSNNINIAVNFTATWFEDADGDGYGNPASSISDCDQPFGFVGNTLDCDDNNNAISPDATEICNNSIDENCDGTLSEGCCGISLQTTAMNSSCVTAANGNVNLTVLGGVGQITYVWSNGSTTQDISGLVPGTYSVQVTDGNACTATAEAIVGDDGLSGPSTPSNITGPYGVCVGQTGILFTVDLVPGATSYVWVLPTGLSGSSTTNSIMVNVASNFNTSNICVRAVNECGQSAQYCKAVFRFNSLPPTPGPITGQSVGVCAGTTQTYSISPISTANNYVWSAPNNTSIISGQGTTTVTVQFHENYGNNGVLRVQSQNCFGLSGNRNLTIYNIPAMPGNITGPANNVCGGTTHTYSILAVSGATGYNWTVPEGATINSGQGTTSISVTFPTGYYSGQIGVSALSECGTSAPRLRNIYLNPIISSAIAGTFYNLCGGGNYTYSIPAVIGASSYSWTVPNGCSIVTNNGNSIQLNVPSNFVSGTVCVTALNSCGGSVSTCRSIYARPDVPAAISGPTSVCPGQTNLAYSTTPVSGLNYNWTIASGGTINSGQGTSSINATWGTASGTLSVSAANVCGSSVVRNLGVAVVSCMQNEEQTSSIEQGEKAELSIYPNPNDGQFFVKCNADGYFVLLNNVGQVVQSFYLSSKNGLTEELKGLPTGMYFIQGNTLKGVVIEKIIVTNK